MNIPIFLYGLIPDDLFSRAASGFSAKKKILINIFRCNQVVIKG